MKPHGWIRLVLCGLVAGVVLNLISVALLAERPLQHLTM